MKMIDAKEVGGWTDRRLIYVGGDVNEKRVCSISAANPLISGAGTRNRTRDTRIFSPLLYRLSYPGVKGESSENPCPCQDFFLRSLLQNERRSEIERKIFWARMS